MPRNREILVFVGLLIAAPVVAPATEIALEQYSGYFGGSASSVVIADIDGDEYADFVFADESGGRVSMASRMPALGIIDWVTGLDSPNSLAVGDLDGDGDNDVVVGQYNNIPSTIYPPYPPEEAELLWLENPLVGGGGWTMNVVCRISDAGVRDVAVADMDADGDLDIVFAQSNGLMWAANDGSPADGGWDYHAISFAFVQPWEVGVVDIDGDGDLDVVASDVTGDELAWYESRDLSGDGVPSSPWPSPHSIDASLDGAAGVAVGDIDRDGRPDVVAAAAVGDRVAWYANPGWTKTEIPYAFDGASSVRAVDLDADGDLDILATAENADDVAWFENTDGDGGSWTTWTIDGSSNGAVDADAGDIDGDGDPEVVVASLFDDRAVNLWINRTVHRRFYGNDSIEIRTGLADPRAIEVADVNGDGIEDVITALWIGGEVTAYLGIGDTGTAWWKDDVATGFNLARDVSAADVDGDGDIDILGAALGSEEIRWWENDGGIVPDWTAHVVLSFYDGAHRVEPADFDRDGDVDLAVVAFDADDVSWVENTDGVGTAWSRHDLGAYDGPFDLAVGDLNRDGTPDFVATAYYDDLVEYFINPPGGGPWSVGQVDDLLDGPRGVDLGDIDRDGDLDVVVVVRDAEDIFWYENDGTGTGWTQHNVGTGYFPDGAQVRAVDLDGDGDVDVAAVNQDGDDVFIWKNGSRGDSWTQFKMEQSLDSTWDLDVADINRDGNLDIAVAAGGTADSLVWYPNLGNQISQIYYDSAPAVIEPDDLEEVLAVLVGHHGRAGIDPVIEITELVLEFLHADGVTPLTTSEINSMLVRLELYQDLDNNVRFELPGDTSAASLEDITLVDGVLTWDLTTSGSTVQRMVLPDDAEFFFVVVQADDPGPSTPDKFIVRIPAGGLSAVDTTFNVDVVSEPSSARATDVISIGSELFSDGFEGGTTSKWSATSGG